MACKFPGSLLFFRGRALIYLFPVSRLRQAAFTRHLHIRVIALSNDPGKMESNLLWRNMLSSIRNVFIFT